MTFQFLFTFLVSAKGLSCAVASKASRAGLGSPGFPPARLHSLQGQAGLCVLPCLLFVFNSRQAAWAYHTPVTWMEKKPQIWLCGDTVELCRHTDWALQHLLANWKLSKLKDSFSSHPGSPQRTREQQDLGLQSKSTHQGAHLAFLVLLLSFHCCEGSLYLERCTRMIKRALCELYCISGFHTSIRLRCNWYILIDIFLRELHHSGSSHFSLGYINFRDCFL